MWLLALFAVSSSPLPPTLGIPVAYDVRTWNGSATPSPDGTFIISHGDGGLPTFRVEAKEHGPGGEWRVRLLSAGGLDDFEVEAKDVVEWRPHPNAPLSPEEKHFALVRGLEAHRPAVAAVAAETGPAGEMRLLPNRELKDHHTCGAALLERSLDHVVAAAENESQRKHWRKEVPAEILRIDTRGPSTLLRLMSLDLKATDHGRWSESYAQMQARREADDDESQYSVRGEAIAAFGWDVALKLDLLSSIDGPAARYCRSIRLPDRVSGEIVSDECEISAVIDRRDGWPLVLGTSRKVETANRGSTSAGFIFSRLVPLRGYVPPPDPCGEKPRP